jgi:hypothetical protein
MRVLKEDVLSLFVALGHTEAPQWELSTLEEKVNQDGGVARFVDETVPVPEEHTELFAALRDATARGEAIHILTQEPVHIDVGGAEFESPVTVVSVSETAQPEVFPLGDDTVVETGHAESQPEEAPAPEKPRSRRGRPKKGEEKPRRMVVTRIDRSAKTPRKKMGNTKKVDGRPDRSKNYQGYKEFVKKHPLKITGRGPGIMRTVVKLLEKAGEKEKPVTKKAIMTVLVTKFKDRDPEKMKVNLNNLLPGRLRDIYHVDVRKEKLPRGGTGWYVKGHYLPEAEPQGRKKAMA